MTAIFMYCCMYVNRPTNKIDVTKMCGDIFAMYDLMSTKEIEFEF
jgi:hypothetical protein